MKNNNCCGGISLQSCNNELEILVRQLQREVNKLMQTTEARLLCQSKKIDETMVYIKNNLSNALRDLLDSMLESGELEEIITSVISNDISLLETEVEQLRQEVHSNDEDIALLKLKFDRVINVKELGAKGDGITDDSLILQSAFNSGKVVFIPKGTYLTSTELTVSDDTTIIGESERQSIIKANGIDLDSVIRLSKSLVGEDTTEASNGIVLKNITIDAEGVDYGIYTNYLTNESRLENITVVNASKINICIGKSWFSKYINLTAKNGKNVGFSIGIKQNNEVDYSVNGIDFINLRAHNNGTDESHNQNTNIFRGAGFIIGGCQTCNFDIIQSEANYGIGVIFDNYYSNHINTMYLENNSKNQLNKYSLYQTSNSTNGQIIDKILLSSEQTILSDNKLFINTLSRVDNLRSLYGTGKIYVDYMDYIVLNNQNDFSMINYSFKELYSKKGINLRYTSTLDDEFINAGAVGYPFIILIPKVTATSTSNVTLKLNNNNVNLGTEFTADTPIIIRTVGIQSNSFINTIKLTNNANLDIECDIFLGYFLYGSKFDSLPSKPF